MKTTIEIEDSLQERVDSAIEDVQTELLRYLNENKSDSLPCLNNDLDYSGAIHEIIDGSVSIHTYELECTWFLHSDVLETALDNSGCYSGEDLAKLSNDQRIMSACYFYIQDQVNEWYNDNAQNVFDEWQVSKEVEAS